MVIPRRTSIERTRLEGAKVVATGLSDMIHHRSGDRLCGTSFTGTIQPQRCLTPYGRIPRKCAPENEKGCLMFEDSLVESSVSHLTPARRWTAIVSITLQCSVAVLLATIPLLHPERLALRIDAPPVLMPLIPKPPAKIEPKQIWDAVWAVAGASGIAFDVALDICSCFQPATPHPATPLPQPLPSTSA